MSGDKVLEHLEFAGGKVPTGDIPGRACWQVQGECDEDVCTPAWHDVDPQLSGERLDLAVQAADARRVGGEHTAAVVAYIDQQVFAVAVPLRPYPADVGLFHHGQHKSADDGPSRVGNLAGQGPSIRWWFDEFDLKAAEARERSQVLPQAFEGYGDWHFYQVRGAVAESPEPDQGLD